MVNPVRIAMRATKTVTTRPIPITASRLTCQRVRTLRTLYEMGNAIAYTCLSISVMRAR